MAKDFDKSELSEKFEKASVILLFVGFLLLFVPFMFGPGDGMYIYNERFDKQVNVSKEIGFTYMLFFLLLVFTEVGCRKMNNRAILRTRMLMCMTSTMFFLSFFVITGAGLLISIDMTVVSTLMALSVRYSGETP